jgi:hypothetical protein
VIRHPHEFPGDLELSNTDGVELIDLDSSRDLVTRSFGGGVKPMEVKRSVPTIRTVLVNDPEQNEVRLFIESLIDLLICL